MTDHAVCPCCGQVTVWTDTDSDNDPDLPAECNHCGCEFDLYYADFVDEAEA
jgi:hypothetical protein